MIIKTGKWLVVLTLCLISYQVLSQQFYIRKHEIDKTQPNILVNTIYQSADGFIWLGTNIGLVKFNGLDYEWHVLPDSLKAISVTAIGEDKDNKLWVGYESGKIAILGNGHLALFNPEEGTPSVAISGILSDSHGVVWIATYGEGLYAWNGNHLYNFNTDDGLTDNFLYDMAKDGLENIWVGTDAGINICQIRGQAKNIHKLGPEDGLPDNIVRSLEPDDKGNMWIGMYDSGVCRYSLNHKKFIVGATSKNWKYGPVNRLSYFSNRLWVGTNGNGIIEITKNKAQQLVSTETKLSGSKIYDLLDDCEGNIWVSASMEGLLSMNKRLKFFNTHTNPVFHDIRAIAKGSRHNIWFSNQEGLYLYDTELKPGDENITHFLGGKEFEKLHIISLYEDKFHNVWIGTFGQGLFLLNPATNKVRKFTEKNGLINDNILSIDGSEDEIWFGTLGGAFRLKLGDNNANPYSFDFESYSSEQNLGVNYIYQVLIDHKNNVWFATDGNGLFKLEHGKFRKFDKNDGLTSEVIYSLTEDINGNIWVATADAGLYCYNGKEFKQFTTASGLYSNAISSLSSDSSGNVIIAHDDGIEIYQVKDSSFCVFGNNAGIDEINPDLNAISRGLAENVWIGTQNGIINFNSFGSDFVHRPVTRITDVQLFLEDIKMERFSHLFYDQNYITFHYIGLWYQAPENVKYQYKLDGYNNDWITTNDKSVTFAKLSPGQYTFQVRSSITDNFKKTSTESFSFVIKPPYWTTWWFILIIGLVIIGIAILFIRSREKRLRQRDQLLRENIRFQFETLRNQVNPHFLFNSFNTLISIIDENKEVAIDYVEKLSDFFRNILHYRKKELITLKEEISLLETYYFLQKKRYGDNFQLDIDLSSNLEKYYIPPLTLQLLVENALKHNIVSKSKKLMVKIIQEDEYLVISNNLQKKDTSHEESTGTGLENISSRYKLLMNKEVIIRQKNGHFVVKVPLISF